MLESGEIASLLQAKGLRVTPQRVAVLGVLSASREHLSAEEVFGQVRQELPNISLATVYKALGELRRVGELCALPVLGRLRFDLISNPAHHHLVCESCQRVVDVELDRFRPEMPSKGLMGFDILGVEVIFRS
ncbi:MAG: Fur family transcriptional regulator, partial [Actinomycetota bacterium]